MCRRRLQLPWPFWCVLERHECEMASRLTLYGLPSGSLQCTGTQRTLVVPVKQRNQLLDRHRIQPSWKHLVKHSEEVVKVQPHVFVECCGILARLPTSDSIDLGLVAVHAIGVLETICPFHLPTGLYHQLKRMPVDYAMFHNFTIDVFIQHDAILVNVTLCVLGDDGSFQLIFHGWRASWGGLRRIHLFSWCRGFGSWVSRRSMWCLGQLPTDGPSNSSMSRASHGFPSSSSSSSGCPASDGKARSSSAVIFSGTETDGIDLFVFSLSDVKTCTNFTGRCSILGMWSLIVASPAGRLRLWSDCWYCGVKISVMCKQCNVAIMYPTISQRLSSVSNAWNWSRNSNRAGNLSLSIQRSLSLPFSPPRISLSNQVFNLSMKVVKISESPYTKGSGALIKAAWSTPRSFNCWFHQTRLPLTRSMMAFQSPWGSRCPHAWSGSTPCSPQISFPDQTMTEITRMAEPWSLYFDIKSLTIATFALQSCCKSLPQSMSWPISRTMSDLRAARSSFMVYFFKVLPFPVINASVESDVTT